MSVVEFQLNGQLLFLYFQCNQDTVELHLLNATKVWTGSLNLRKAKIADIDYEEYRKLILQSLRKQDMTSSQFTHEFLYNRHANTYTFTIQFSVGADPAGKSQSQDELAGGLTKLTAAQVVLESEDSSEAFFKAFLQRMAIQSTELYDFNDRVQRLSVQVSELQALAAEAVNSKAALELNYLSKFVSVLNEKKAKIRTLSHMIDSLEKKIERHSDHLTNPTPPIRDTSPKLSARPEREAAEKPVLSAQPSPEQPPRVPPPHEEVMPVDSDSGYESPNFDEVVTSPKKSRTRGDSSHVTPAKRMKSDKSEGHPTPVIATGKTSPTPVKGLGTPARGILKKAPAKLEPTVRVANTFDFSTQELLSDDV